jgi:hypothetical protein
MADPCFVGRKVEFAQAVSLLEGEEGGVIAVVGIHGIGKTSLLERVREHATGVNGTVTPPITDMASVAIGHHDLDGAETAKSLWQTFDRSQTLLLNMVDWMSAGRDFATFKQAARAEAREVKAAIAGNELSAAGRATVAHVEMTSHVEYDEETVKDAIRRGQKRIDDEFAEAWDTWTVRHRMLLAIDHFEAVARLGLGQWVLRMALRLPRLVTILSCSPAAGALLPRTDRVSMTHLEGFTVQEVQDYLTKRFSPLLVHAQVPALVDRFTDGHPGGVKLVADLINEHQNVRCDPAALHRTLDRLPNEPWAKWVQLVRLILSAVDDPLLLQAVDACAAVNSFDEPLLAALLDSEAGSVGHVISALEGYGLIRPTGDRPGEVGDHPGAALHQRPRFVLREFVRRALVRDLQKNPRRWEVLNERAVEHYRGRIEELEADNSNTYSGWYRYEDPEWRRCKTEWLFHSGRLSGSEELTRTRFARVFFEAFFWWGCYENFHFTRTLLWDWARPAADEEDLPTPFVLPGSDKDDQLREALTFVLEYYPQGHIKASERWADIRDRLLLVQSLCGLGRGGKLRSLPEAAEDAARTAGFIRIFLAHTRRFQPSKAHDADCYYQDALDIFEQLGDCWVTAWLLFERADLALELGDGARGVALLELAAARIVTMVGEGGEDWDEELVANLCRARADAHWLASEVPEAFGWYGRAVLHAYRLQGIPHEPDRYTQRFYLEMTSRVAQRLLETHAQAPDDACAHARQLRHVLAGEDDPAEGAEVGLAGADATAVAAGLFPAPPSPDELGTEASAFMDRWRRFDDLASATAPHVNALLPADAEREDPPPVP